jgi:formylglycine-generating enzyme required for sulfatase activity/tRNA A-37 threonylcarbamoyl transferase component Bud32
MTDDLKTLQEALSGDYTVERELGRGGMATVYLATDIRHDRRVAVKVFRSEFAAAIGHERFLREIRTTAQLTNAHILPLLDSGEAAGFLYYVMPYIEGESLQDRIDRQSQLPVDDAISITSDVAAALAYAHSRGVIHRDVKPANIMLSSGEAIVMDFGIARAVAGEHEETLTSTGLTVGTPAYMSPEQSTGERVDARTDIYSLGSVTYEMLAGEPPYTGANPQAVIAKRLSEDPPRISVIREIPAHVEAAIRKALARAPADRWARVSDYAEALRGERTTQSSVVPPVPPNARARMRTAIVSGAAVIVITAVALLATRSWRLGGASERTTEAPLSPPAGMVLVPGGTFTLYGGTCADCLPSKAITVDSFFIDRTEVTASAFRGAGEDNQLPASGVMWPEAHAYCESRGARLPTEAEWEAAARGTDAREYPWGNTWAAGNANAAGVSQALRAVGTFPRGVSPYGAVDMVGNVWEWTSTEAPLSSDGRRRHIMRGGAYDTPAASATAYYRVAFVEAMAPSQRQLNYGKIGVRCARAMR